ncbi:MAG: hypothetical protein KatS3mg105_1133 [Gemmatales bacterium]|nr:MAG: hypothetical protein KatS3mg105_1133 [Gemmatales bacterium]
MTGWRIRHEGSPHSIDHVTFDDIVEGIQDGLLDPTDEVMGPGDSEWQPLESHPHFADIVADWQPPPRRDDDEMRLDMNPLIDVALVLLIFFILTTSYASLQRVLAMPDTTKKQPEGPVVVTQERVKQFTIRIRVRQVDGKPVIRVEDEVVSPENLLPTIQRYVRQTNRTEVVLDVEDVDWGTVVMVQDAAKGAGVQRAYFLAKH